MVYYICKIKKKIKIKKSGICGKKNNFKKVRKPIDKPKNTWYTIYVIKRKEVI